MPQQPSPPYVQGATSIPRMLNRWLDINPQNGPLQRTQAFIVLPAFVGVNESWLGSSDIVWSQNFEAPNNFSITNLSGIVQGAPNYTLAISYIKSGVITRYILWHGAGDNLGQVYPLYTNQPILKNFRFEVWSTSQGQARQSSAITFYTTVRGSLDYRYGLDNALVNGDTPCTNFENINTATPLPTDVVYRYDSSLGITLGGGNVTAWRDQVSNIVLTNTGTVLYSFNATVNKNVVTTLAGSIVSGAGAGNNPGTIAIAFMMVDLTTTGTIVDDGGGVKLGYNHATGFFTGFVNATGSKTVQANVWYLAVLHPNNGNVEVYNLITGLLFDNFFGSSSTSPDVTLQIGGTNITVAEALFFNTDIYLDNNYYNTYGYFYSRYTNAFSLPLTFPANSISQSN